MTILIGMLRESGSPGNVATAMALVAAARGADFIFFRPEDVDLPRGRISALRFDGSLWIKTDSRFPDVIENDDRSMLPRHQAVWKALTRVAPRTTPRLGGKLEITRRAARDPVFAALLIPEAPADSDERIHAWLEEHGEIALKPVFGSQGRGIRRLRLWEGAIQLTRSEEEAPGILAPGCALQGPLCGDEPYLIQKFIRSALPGESPFDIRLHIRRNGSARWEVVKLYARIGRPGTIISNLSAGGSIGDVLPLLRLRYGAAAKGVMAHLHELARDLPRRLQRQYPSTMIDALGIDLGLDEEGRPWLFEANSYPGAKYFEMRDAQPRIGFCLWLAARAKQRQQERQLEEPEEAPPLPLRMKGL